MKFFGQRVAAAASFGLFIFGALPVHPASAMVARTRLGNPLTMQARIICEQDGTCIRLPRRRPVARWIYGDGNFHGPFAGPGYYGNPATRSRWILWPTF